MIGFVVSPKRGRPIYLSGDTVWFDGVAEVGAFPEAVIMPLHTDGWAHFPPKRRRFARYFRHARIWQTAEIARAGVCTVIEA